ncbi:MAG: hypothetical protein JW809_03355 [Pirellulales bacterium]|nr:hypothetical protein [Pirellulales bacterium]
MTLQEVKATPRILECAGPDQRASASENPWTLFLLYEPDNRPKAIRYWVSQDGLLQRVQLNAQNRLDLVVEEQGKSDATM